MSFERDVTFSREMDVKLKKFWGSMAHEGRFTLASRLFTMKTRGSEILIQKNEHDEVLMDTKHCRRVHDVLFLEELSNPKTGKQGWLVEDKPVPPHYIFFGMWDGNRCRAWIVPFKPLREWFLKNKGRLTFFFNRGLWNINRSKCYKAPIATIVKEIPDVRYIDITC